MRASLVLALGLGLVPAVALADNGADSRASQFTELSYATMRDGRSDRRMEEGRANKAAFDSLRDRERSYREPTSTASVPRRRR